MTSAPESAILETTQLCKSYGALKAVDGVSFEVRPGEIVGLVGPNGAGKTTIINMVLGVLQPTSGRVVIEGLDVARSRSQALSRTNFAAVYAPLPGNLTVEQNLRIFGLIYDVPRLGERIASLLQEFDLERFARTKCGLLSSGEQTRVSLAKAMLNRPRLLLLDEPTASIDPATAREIRAHIQRIASDGGGGILWTSHNMYEVAEVCDRVLFISRGRILLQGEPEALVRAHGASSLEDLFVTVANETLAGEKPAS